MASTLMTNIEIGMNIRFPPSASRTVVEEIAFARFARCDSVQFAVREPGDFATRLGAPLPELGNALRETRLTSVMELIVRIDAFGRNNIGQAPLDVLQTNIPVIVALGCACVHWHLVPQDRTLDETALTGLEDTLLPQFAAAVQIASDHGFRFGFEHNEPLLGLFAAPERCARMLDNVPRLGFVWDVNHTIPEHVEAFVALTPHMTMLHISDTPLPTVNYHLPLGNGSIDFPRYCRELLQRGFSGPAILEIGGLPQSGGYGQDTDTALIASRERFADALHTAERQLTPVYRQSTAETTEP